VDPVLDLCVPDSHRRNHGQGPLGLLRCELVAQPLEPVELEGLTLREFLIRAVQDRAEGVLWQRMESESGKPPRRPGGRAVRPRGRGRAMTDLGLEHLLAEEEKIERRGARSLRSVVREPEPLEDVADIADDLCARYSVTDPTVRRSVEGQLQTLAKYLRRMAADER